jgi:hypothetical protein
VGSIEMEFIQNFGGVLVGSPIRGCEYILIDLQKRSFESKNGYGWIRASIWVLVM